MLYFIFDGTFSGLLTAVYEAYYNSDGPPDKIYSGDKYRGNLFVERVEITTDQSKADRVYNAVREKISPRVLRKIYYAFLSERENIGTDIYRFLRLGFKIGKEIENHISDDRVLLINRISQKVGREKHRLLGLIRFRKLEGDFFYAPVEPDYNIIVLLAPHFASRMGDQNWIIHDLKRKMAVVYNREEWFLTELDKREINITGEEAHYQELWREFFASIAIENRKNPRLQRQFMPERYWKYLIEKGDSQ